MPVGNVNSKERGSGARYNDGKPDLSLIPPTLLAHGSLEHLELQDALNTFMFKGDISELRLWHAGMMEKYSADCANVFTYGANKYAAWNWAKGMFWSIPIACALRHADALWLREEENDAESTLPHIGHILCNTTMILWYHANFPEGNNLPYKVLNNDA